MQTEIIQKWHTANKTEIKQTNTMTNNGAHNKNMDTKNVLFNKNLTQMRKT